MTSYPWGEAHAPAFGHQIREEEFSLDPDTVYLNQGSYGVVPSRIRQLHIQHLAETDRDPDLYYRVRKEGVVNAARAVVADFLCADVDGIALVSTAMNGLNAVLRSVRLCPGEAVLLHSWSYGGLKCAAKAVTDSLPGAEVLSLQLPLPITGADQVVALYADMLERNSHIRLVVIDHICSAPPAVLPVAAVVALCRRRRVLTLVDGAHGPGQLPLAITDLGAHFYVGNFQKWAYSVKSCSFIYAAPAQRHLVKPAVVAHRYELPLPECFLHYGTSDETPISMVTHSLQFIEWLGGIEAIRKYTDSLFEEGLRMLTEAFGSETLPVPKEMEAPFMKCVRCPDMKHIEKNNEGAKLLFILLHVRHRIWCPVFLAGGALWLRISLSVYSTLDDVVRLRAAVEELRDAGPVQMTPELTDQLERFGS